MDIILNLNAGELKGLREYIHSPFFNKNKNVQKLFDYVAKQSPEFAPEKMKKEYVFKKLFGNDAFNDGFMRSLIFMITKLAEDYLAYIYYSKDSYNSKVCLIHELNDRNIERILSKNIKLFEKEFSEEKVKDDKYFKAKYELEAIKNDSQILKDRFLNKKEIKDDLTHHLLEYKIIQFFISIISNYIFILNREHLVNMDHDLIFLNDIIAFIEKNKDHYSEVPILMFYYSHLRMTMEPDNEQYYKELKKIVLNPENLMSHMDRYNGIIGLQNFCIRQYNSGKREYQHEFFNMLQFTLDGGFYTPQKGGDFVPQNFKNYVIFGTNMKKYEWTENFIKNYMKKLSPDHRENAYNFSMAKIYFSKDDFEKALGYISRVSYQDLYYKLEVRYYTLMIYYELSMFNEAYDLIESYRKYMIKNKLLNSQLNSKHLTFIKFCKELLRLKSTGNIKKIPQIEKAILNSKYILHSPWLLKKLEELDKSSK